jgi:hypothetical protein
MSATLIKLASSHRLTPVVGFDEKTGFILWFTQADGIKPHALSRHTKDSHSVPRWGERSLSLAFAFSDFSFQLFPCGVTEPTLALVPRTKPRHGSARARCLTRQISDRSTPLHEPLRRSPVRLAPARTFRCVPTDRKLARQAGRACAARLAGLHRGFAA